MALSNTATPKYYAEFRDKVIRGEILVCREIAMEMSRIDERIANPGIYYDAAMVEGFVKYCENEMTLTDGSDVKMLETFKVWGEQIFGWYYFVDMTVWEPIEGTSAGRYVTKRVKKRLINKFYLIIARSNAKSLFESFVQSYMQNIDTTTTYQITTAPTMKQADEVMSPIRTAISRARGPLMQFLTEGSINSSKNSAMRPKLYSSKKGIQNDLTGSTIEVRPMSIDKLQGMRCKVATIDEWLSGDIREDVIGAIEQGAAKVDDYLILAVSSEGTVRNGPGDSIKMELEDILRGKYANPFCSIFYYKIDSLDEVGKPECWVKANPNIGFTVQPETIQLDVERAEKAPVNRNDILAKRFNWPMEGYTYYFSYEETLRHPPQQFWQCECAMGIDLSQGDDFCAFTFLFPRVGDMFGVKTRNYITVTKLNKLAPAMRAKYDEFINEGSVIVQDKTVLDMMEVYDDLDQFIELNGYDVRCVGYDPYNAQTFIDRWTNENGPFGVLMVRQGYKTETVPLGELKIYSEQRRLIFDQSVMQFAMGNCIVMEDSNGNRKLMKRRYEQKIDPVSALMDAYVAYKENREAFG